MHKKGPVTYNPYFIFPFLVWVVVGGILLSMYTKEQLFFGINLHYTPVMDTLMYYTTWMGEGGFVAIMLLLSLGIKRFRTWTYFITATLCSMTPFLIQQYLKRYFSAPRPRLYFHDSPLMHYLPTWPSLIHNSFPSGHSEGAFSFFCFLSLLLPEQYKRWGLVFFGLAISVCYSRIYLTAHFFADVYAGSIIGATVTTLVYSLLYHNREKLFHKKDNFI